MPRRTADLKSGRPPLHACTVRMAAWAIVLAALGLALLLPDPAQAQMVDTSGQSYYVNAKPLLDFPLPDLLRAAPELQGLEPAANQDELASLLQKTGQATEDLLGSMPNLISREEVTETKLNRQGNSKEQRRHEFEYLILVHRQDMNVTLEDYRPGPDQASLEDSDLGAGFMLTRGFASSWLHFLPVNQSGARFRYLGQQNEDGFKCHVVGFAQKPGWATITATVIYAGRPVLILSQGIAWIDEATFRIVRLRTDLLAPHTDIGLERQTTELHFGETRLPQTTSPLWLPLEVVVTGEANKQLFRNIHRYSDYRLYRVETKILPAPPGQP